MRREDPGLRARRCRIGAPLLPPILVLGLLILCIGLTPSVAATAKPRSEADDAILQEAVALVAGGQREKAIACLEELERGSLSPAISPKVDFLLGMLYGKEQRWAQAKRHLEKAAASYPQLADYSLAQLAEANLQLGEPGSAIRSLRRLLALPQSSRWKRLGSLRLGDAYRAAGEVAEARKAYRGIIQGSSSLVPRARLALAEMALSQGQREEAALHLRQIDLKHPASPEAQSARKLGEKLHPPLLLNWHERFQRAETLLAAGRNQMALQEFRSLAKDGSASVGNVRRASLLAGTSSFRTRDYRGAVEFLLPLAELEGARESEEARYWLGRSYLRLGKREEGRFQLLSLASRFPRSPWADDAWYRLGLDEEEEGDFFQARDSFSRLIQTHPASELLEDALWHRAWAAYRQGELSPALRDLQAYSSRREGSAPGGSSRYWMGRILEGLEQPDAAALQYEGILSSSRFDYYYFRALNRRAGIDAFQEKGAISQVHAEVGAKPPAAAPASSRDRDAADPFLLRARELAALGLGEEALAEYGEAISHTHGDDVLVEEACSESLRMERPEKALYWARKYLPLDENQLERVRTSGQPSYHYPLAYWEELQGPSRDVEVDPYLVLAVIREESGFSPTCVSKAGARGLMQLMPSTAALVARGLGASLRRNGDDLFRPELNIRLGTQYLADQIKAFAGDLALALAAYNAGPHAVERWLSKRAGLDQEEFIESIPFGETRAYVKKVLGSYEVYRLLYEGRT